MPTNADPYRPGDLAWEIVGRVEDSASIHDGPEVFLTQFEALSGPERHLLATHWCNHEVCNGGFQQFFGNSTGVLAPEAVAGYRALGLPKVAATVARAMNCFGNSYPRDRGMRCAMIDQLSSTSPGGKTPFDELDEQYYSLLPDDAFGRAADTYAANHVV